MSDEVNETAHRTQSASSAATLDPRRFPFRADLAAESLYGKVSAPRYVQGYPAQVVRAAVALRRQPKKTAGFETEALFGEIVTVYEQNQGWAWVQLARDNYVGYLPADALTRELSETTHRVKALGTFLYPVPDIKSPPLMHLSLNAELCVSAINEGFCALKGGGYIVSRHVRERGQHARDFVELAERFIGTPYLWGGRTRIGIDCSGLVQVVLEASGIGAPRDTDMQQAEVGSDVLVPDRLEEGLQRGDLVFWKGHVGIMVDSVMMVHANAHHMAVHVETLPEAAERVAKAGGKLTAIKRLPALCA